MIEYYEDHRWVRRHTLTPIQNGVNPPHIECSCGVTWWTK